MGWLARVALADGTRPTVGTVVRSVRREVSDGTPALETAAMRRFADTTPADRTRLAKALRLPPEDATHFAEGEEAARELALRAAAASVGHDGMGLQGAAQIFADEALHRLPASLDVTRFLDDARPTLVAVGPELFNPLQQEKLLALENRGSSGRIERELSPLQAVEDALKRRNDPESVPSVMAARRELEAFARNAQDAAKGLKLYAQIAINLNSDDAVMRLLGPNDRPFADQCADARAAISRIGLEDARRLASTHLEEYVSARRALMAGEERLTRARSALTAPPYQAVKEAFEKASAIREELEATNPAAAAVVGKRMEAALATLQQSNLGYGDVPGELTYRTFRPPELGWLSAPSNPAYRTDALTAGLVSAGSDRAYASVTSLPADLSEDELRKIVVGVRLKLGGLSEISHRNLLDEPAQRWLDNLRFRDTPTQTLESFKQLTGQFEDPQKLPNAREIERALVDTGLLLTGGASKVTRDDLLTAADAMVAQQRIWDELQADSASPGFAPFGGALAQAVAALRMSL